MTAGRQLSSRTLRRGLVEELETAGAITDPAVRRAFLAVPRERFLAETARSRGLAAVYANKAIVTRTGRRGGPDGARISVTESIDGEHRSPGSVGDGLFDLDRTGRSALATGWRAPPA